jgi:bifunctional non-homologous end joining protein LigD
VVQEHHARRLHYDVRLERRAFRVVGGAEGPAERPGHEPSGRQTGTTADYGSFAGEIPKGEYGAGSVTIWDPAPMWRMLDGREAIATLSDDRRRPRRECRAATP